MAEPKQPSLRLPTAGQPRGLVFRLLAAATVALITACSVANADTYPTRPVHLIVAFAAGGTNDIVARLLGQSLSERLGQPVIIENKPGAGSNVGTEVVAHAPPDGYTLLMAGTPNAINATLYDKLPFNFIHDIAPVAGVLSMPDVMEVNPSLPVRTVPEFVAYARANPGKVAMASAGTGGATHVAGELFKAMTGINMVHVPYRGDAPALVDLMGGQVQVMFDLMPASIEYIRGDKLRPLAVTTAVRSEALLDLPTVGEFVPGYEASAWLGVGVPQQTPVEIIAKLNQEINAVLANPKFKAQLAGLGGRVLPGSPAEFSKLIADETEKWGRVIRTANIKLE